MAVTGNVFGLSLAETQALGAGRVRGSGEAAAAKRLAPPARTT